MNAGPIDYATHNPTERINLSNQVALANTPDGWIARHLPYEIQVERYESSISAETSRGRSSFTSRMAAADHDYIKKFIEDHKVRPSLKFLFSNTESGKDFPKYLIGSRLAGYLTKISQCVQKANQDYFLARTIEEQILGRPNRVDGPHQ